MRYLWVGIVCCFIMISGCQCIKRPDSTRTAVVFTSSLQGYIEPCGCTSDPLGGLARIATVFKKFQKELKNQAILIDTGDLVFENTQPLNPADRCTEEAKAMLIMSVLHGIGLAATVTGERDLSNGKAFYDSLLQQYPVSRPGISDQKPLIIQAGQNLIGIVDLSTPEVLTSQINWLQEKGAKVIIAISQLNLSRSEAMAGLTKGLDIVLLGNSPGEAPTLPRQVSTMGPWFISAGQQGQYLGVLEFSHLDKRLPQTALTIDTSVEEKRQRLEILEQRIQLLKQQIALTTAQDKLTFLTMRLERAQQEENEIKSERPAAPQSQEPSFTFRAIPIKRDITPDPSIQAQTQAYEKKIPELTKQCESTIECPSLKAGEPSFIGAESCKSCHAAAYNVWKAAIVSKKMKSTSGQLELRQVGHSKAWATLLDVHKDQDRSCIGCHSIGFMQPGGYCKTNDVGMFKNVQCEACHGPGSLHAQTGKKEHIRGKVTEQVCRECHHVPHIPTTNSFVFNEQVQLILGPGHGETLLKRLQHRPD